MEKKPFEGIFPYLVSPVGEDGSIREEALRKLVSHLIESGVHGLTPLGSTGEFYYLDWGQKRRIVEIVLEETRRRVPVVAGVAASTVREAAYEARELERMGVDGILSILNVYFPLSQREIGGYFLQVADSVDCPVVVYQNPKFSHFTMTPDLLEELTAAPNIQYYKDASGDTGSLLSAAQCLGGRIRIFSASAHVPVFVMMLGGVGWMSGPACVIPRQSVRLYELCREKRWDEAMELQKKLWGINRVFQKYNLAGCIKAALQMQGFDVGSPIPPNRAVGRDGREEIRRALEALKE